jgi:isoquinoline 1-oxidoreductase subunit beta
MTITFDRRAFLTVSGGLGLSLALPGSAEATDLKTANLTAYLLIEPDGVTVISPVTEMGQGTFAAHAAIVADELGVAYETVRVRTAEPAEPYRRPALVGPSSMATGGSWGVRFWRDPLRKAAAQAREILIAAAAAEWKTTPDRLAMRDGFVVEIAGRRRARLAQFAPAAAKLTPPEKPPLRPASERRYYGKNLRRPDLPDKVRGRTIYAADFKRPGMVFACARLAPFGAEATTLKDAAARAVAGVTDIVTFPGGVAVVAKSQWAAMQGAGALAFDTAGSPDPKLDSAKISAAMRAGLGGASKAISKNDGDFAAALANAARVVSADYEAQYLNHAPMEPWSCVVEIAADGSAQIWAPTQNQDRARSGAATALGVAPDKVRIHTLMLGGGFGRRLGDDGIRPAALVAKAVGMPLKFFWRREEEFLAGWLRPAMAARLTAAIDAQGEVTGLHIRTSGPSLRRSFMGTQVAPGKEAEFVDGSAVQNLDAIRYKTGAYRLDYVMAHNAVTLAPWRAVGASHNAFFLETFIDEVARAVGKDPVSLRRELLAHDPRALRLIDETATKGDWGKPLPQGRARGFAFFESYGSLCAQVIEASIVDGEPRVHRVVCVLDCGEVATPDGARAQIEGQVVMGLSAALYEEATVANGAMVETNFDTYRIMRMSECPVIESHFLTDPASPIGGVGEPPLPPTAPALANALAALTGKPVRALPLVKQSWA